MIECIGFLVYFQCKQMNIRQVDSFCLTYQQVIQSRGDGNLQGTSGAKRRILANELTYRKVCLQKRTP